MLLTYARRIAAHRRRLRLLQSGIVFAAIALNACSELSGPKEPSISGTYDLADIGGSAVPAVIYQGPFNYAGQRWNIQLQVHHGSLELDGNGYTLFVIMVMNGDGFNNTPLPYIDTGTFTKNGSQITFTSDDDVGFSFGGTETANGTVALGLDLAGNRQLLAYHFQK